jgi:hypothetical protein
LHIVEPTSPEIVSPDTVKRLSISLNATNTVTKSSESLDADEELGPSSAPTGRGKKKRRRRRRRDKKVNQTNADDI